MRSLCSLLATCTFVLTYPSTAAMGADDNCREFTSTANIGGQEQQVVGMACLQPDGTWRSRTASGIERGQPPMQPPPVVAVPAPYPPPPPIGDHQFGDHQFLLVPHCFSVISTIATTFMIVTSSTNTIAPTMWGGIELGSNVEIASRPCR